MHQPRHPAGTPAGGRWAAPGRGEAALDLGEVGDQRLVLPDLIETSPAAEKVLDTIRKAGGQPILVGGSVRDALIAHLDGTENPDPEDVDIEVYGASADHLVDALSPIGCASEVGVSFGVIKARVDGEDFDVSLPRRESKTADGHRGFDVDADPDLDYASAFARRDFTVNAIGWDPATGEVIDPHGGVADIEARVLRHTSDAFDEDPERVLRGVRFAGRLGFELAPETVRRCRELSGQFDKLPVERVWAEWHKIATQSRVPSKALDALRQVGWERHFPELAAIRGVPQDRHWHPEGSVDVHTGQAADAAAAIADRDRLDDADREVVVLGAICHDFGKASTTVLPDPSLAPTPGGGRIHSHGHATVGADVARSFLARIGAPARTQDQVAAIVREHMACTSIGDREPDAADVRRLMRRLDANGRGVGIGQWARVCEADRGGRGMASGPTPAWDWVAIADSFPPERPALKPVLTGKHLIAAGLKPGPEFTPILAAALEAQDSGEFDDEAGALSWLREQAVG